MNIGTPTATASSHQATRNQSGMLMKERTKEGRKPSIRANYAAGLKATQAANDDQT